MDSFEEGQIWKYETRSNEVDSRLVILKVEKYPNLGEIVHIYVDGLEILNPDKPEAPHTDISHMPFASEAVRRSCVELIGTCELPDFADGYECWKNEFENGGAGVFSVSVKESIEFMEETLNQSDGIDEC